jgi:drug/metabolite transporter (DMT)-like permease
MSKAELFKLALTIFIAVTFIVIGDTAGKLLTSGGVDPFVVAWSRFTIAALVLLPFSGLALKELHHLRDWRVLARAMLICGGIVCILTALKTEPIANVFGAFFVGPIVSYVLAIIFLGEKPSATRNGFLALGFLGVMLVVKPGLGASIGILFALAAGTCHGAYLVMTRSIAGLYRPRFLLMSQLLLGTLFLTPLGLSAELPDLDIQLSALIIISALASAVGNYLFVVVSKTAEASLIAPLVYSQLISATFFGILIFGDWPDAYSLTGLVLIISSGAGSLMASQPTMFARKVK